MLVEKEVIAPGKYWYIDEATEIPRCLDVTPELTKYWHEQGSKMLSAGLPIPVPYEHDFDAHPMTPKEKLLNNAGWVKEYRLKGDKLFSVLDIQDEEVARKLPRTIRWTSPWIKTFTDGDGRQWNNVITHLALTTRPRVTKQQPFSGIAAALSVASEVKIDQLKDLPKGICLSKAGLLFKGKKSGTVRPRYPFAFSAFSGGVRFADDDLPKKVKKKDDGPPDDDSYGSEGGMGDMPAPKKSKSGGGDGSGGDSSGDTGDGLGDGLGGDDLGGDMGGMMNPLMDSGGDVKMEELLCDLLSALGIQMPENVGESEFKRCLYEATMQKVKELAQKGQASGDANAGAAGPNTTSPAGGGGTNPLIQQEQQPMYMSLEQIQQLPDGPTKTVALAMYQENVKLQAALDLNSKATASLRDAKLKEEQAKRQQRIDLLCKLSPRVKEDLAALMANPSMALSLGDGGTVVDPMDATLRMLEKSFGDIPSLLTKEAAFATVQPHPTDATTLTTEEEDALAESFARMMGAPPDRKVPAKAT